MPAPASGPAATSLAATVVSTSPSALVSTSLSPFTASYISRGRSKLERWCEVSPVSFSSVGSFSGKESLPFVPRSGGIGQVPFSAGPCHACLFVGRRLKDAGSGDLLDSDVWRHFGVYGESGCDIDGAPKEWRAHHYKYPGG
ncbi:hypothetical protein PR202_gb16076 [Eleusine coracana subsp. coracana]|uniref:Uncharacterized protein n=1 Tax=Eleusine coracana subsp. coracana TaxID=191504 RepID=A0AAV5EX87_ELECO|nr:hypothetical protein PR202_gb16076 [Eleusine coracana subsp. coracana]